VIHQAKAWLVGAPVKSPLKSQQTIQLKLFRCSRRRGIPFEFMVRIIVNTVKCGVAAAILVIKVVVASNACLFWRAEWVQQSWVLWASALLTDVSVY
jgi:hypothetical protein